MMPIEPSESPFDDVCLHVTLRPRGADADPDLERYRGRVDEAVRRALGGRCRRVKWRGDGGAEVAIHTGREQVHELDGGVAFLEGVANLGAEAWLPGLATSTKLFKLGSRAASQPLLRGHFSAVLGTPDKLWVFTDPLGMSQLYEVELSSGVLLSNRLHLLVEVLRDLRLLRFDEGAMASALALDTSFSYAMPAQGVRLIPAREFVLIDRDGITRRSGFDPVLAAEAATKASYGPLVQQAAEEIRNNWIASESIAAEHPRVLYLTGGVDSRLALAGALAAGGFPLWHYTYGPENGADRRIAAELAAAYDLPRSEEGASGVPDVEGAVERWLSMNYHQRTQAMQLAPELGTGRVRLCGGVGECYRGFYTTMFANKLKAGALEELPGLARQVAAVTGTWKLVHPEALEWFVNELTDTLRGEPLITDTPAGVDGLYLLFRNRFHFGLDLRLNARAALKLAPLYSPSAVVASLLVDPVARRCGKVPYDLLGVLAPKLREFEFERAFDAPAMQSTPGWTPKPLEPSEPRRLSLACDPTLGRASRRFKYPLLLSKALVQVQRRLRDFDNSSFGLIRRQQLLKSIQTVLEEPDVKRMRSQLIRARLALELLESRASG